MSKYKYVLFDADATLLDFKRSEYLAISKILAELGLPAEDHVITTYSEINDSLWKLLEVGGITKEELKTERFRRLCVHFGFDVSPELMSKMYVNALAEQSILLDSAESVCRRLYESGIRLYVITNGIKYIQSKRFAATPIVGYFENIFISEEIGYEKPHIEFFKKATSMINDFDADSTIVIGDSLSSDIKGGINFGLDTCWYNPHGKKKPEDMKITYEIGKLTDILEIVGIR